MRDLGVESRDVFETWLEKEKVHLTKLSKEPVEETLEMEYYQKLVNLRDAEYVPSILFPLSLPDCSPQGACCRDYRGAGPFCPC
jgi:hypothetical protein